MDQEMTREEKIRFIIESAHEFYQSEGEIISEDVEKLSDDALDKEVEWFNYLWEK